MPKIYIGTPMYGGQCFGFYAQSLLSLNNILRDHKIDSMISFMFNESLITRARNALTHTFLKSDCTHLFFIDADIKFNPQDVLGMLLADKPIICGIYPKKELNWENVANAAKAGVPHDKLRYYTGSFVVNLAGYVDQVTVQHDKPCEIWNGGTGFMLIKREVFEQLADKVPEYTNDSTDLSGAIQHQEKIKEYFATSIEPGTNRLLSEDYHFCRIWREIGGKVWAAPWVHLGHAGTHLFDGALATPAYPNPVESR